MTPDESGVEYSTVNVDFEYRISTGVEGVRETMALMRSIVRKGKADPAVIVKARSLTAFAGAKDWRAEVAALHRYVRDSIRYVMDPNGVETLSTPARLIEIGAGDCDDKATLLAALLEAVGHPTRFVAIGLSGGTLDHVYVETKIGDTWIPLETTEPVEAGELPFAPDEVKNRYVVHN